MMTLGKVKVDVLDDTDDNRPRTPIVTGPIIELRGREVIFAISVFFLTAIVVGLIVVLASYKVKEIGDGQSQENSKCTGKADIEACREKVASFSRYCMDIDCVQTAARVLNKMDLSVAPCDDFYSYSCGGWLQESIDNVPDGSWGVDDEAKERIHTYVNTLMENLMCSDKDDTSARCKMKILYDTCLDTQTIDTLGAKPLQDILDDFGGWSALDDWNLGEKSGRWQTQRVLEKLHFIYGADAFFHLDVVPDELNRPFSVLQLERLHQSSFGLSDPSQYSYDENHTSVVAYKTYMATIAKLFNVTDSKSMEFINNTYNLQKSLAKLYIDSAANRQQTRMTVDELQHISQRIKWLPFLRHNFSSVNSSTILIVMDKDYITNISKLLDTADEVDVNGYLIWRLISQVAAPLLSHQFRDAYYTYHQTLAGKHSRINRRTVCQDFLSVWFGKVIGVMYMKDHVTNSTLGQVANMFVNLKQAFRHKLTRCHWMDEKTRKEAKDKLNSISFVVGSHRLFQNESNVDEYYHDFDIHCNISFFDAILNGIQHLIQMKIDALDFNIPQNEWNVNAHDVSSFYSQTENVIGLTAGMLQVPFFDALAPLHMNYGSLGALLAQKMTYAFNEHGASYDKNGSVSTWWTDETWDKFRRETYCMARFYNDMKINCHRVDGQLTLAENIADIGGLRLSYKAYKEYLDLPRIRQHQLPVKDMTNEQFFFIAFAQNYCKKRNPKTIQQFLKNSKYSLEEVRVKGTVSQLEEFAEAFKCRDKSAMNPTDRCLIW